jgi:hypothetical protein
MLNPEVKEGDKIVLVYMKGELGMPPGTKGVVTRVTNDPFEEDDLLISVDWENGRSLSIVSAEDMWMLDSDYKKKNMNLKEEISEQKLPDDPNPCNSLTEGKVFCQRLSDILKNGRGGAGAKTFKKKSYETFGKLREEGFGKNTEIELLEPGNKLFDERIDELKRFFGLLTKYNVCSKMRSEIKKDIINVKGKGLKMISSDEEYSILNRLDTHYSAQAYILTLIAKDLDFYLIDSYNNSQIIEEVDLFILSKPHRIKDKLNSLIDNESKSIEDSLLYSSIKGGRVELSAVKAFEKLGYKVYNFASDFGFVDYFGVDMLVEKDGKIHPVQVSSQRKFNPEIVKYNDSDCECWMVYKDRNSGKFRKETIMEQTKGGQIVESKNYHWKDWEGVQDVLGKSNQSIYDFFEALRMSGVINMLESTNFIYSGADYLKSFIQHEKYGNYNEEEFEELYDLAEKAKHTMIGLAFDSLNKKEIEPTLENMNSEIRKLARLALRSFIMRKSL